MTVFEDQFTGIDAVNHAIHPHIATADAFVHFGVNVQRGEQRIERAGGGVHHKGVVHALMRNVARLPFDMAIFFMDLRGLGETGLLFVNGLRHQNTRIVFVQFQQQRRTIGHHRNKLFIADPGGVKQDVVAQMTNFIDDLTGVINGTVVGA